MIRNPSQPVKLLLTSAYIRPIHKCKHETIRLYSSLPVPLAFDKWSPPVVDLDTPPVLYAHGLFGRRTFCQKLLRSIASKLRAPLYSIDLRNHGESPQKMPHTYEIMAADVAEFINQQQFRTPPAMIGFSMGAKVAMTMGIQSPHLLSRIVSLDQGPMYIDPPFDVCRLLEAMRRADDAQVTQLTDAHAIMEPLAPLKVVREYLLSSFKPHPTTGVLKCQMAIENVSKSLEAILGFPTLTVKPSSVPLLVVHGLQSPFVTQKCVSLLPTLFLHHKVHGIKNASHSLMVEQPKLVANAIIEFLRIKSDVASEITSETGDLVAPV